MSSPELLFITEAATKTALKGHNHLYSQYLLNCKHSLKTARHGAQARHLILQKLYPATSEGRTAPASTMCFHFPTRHLPARVQHPSAIASAQGNVNAQLQQLEGPGPRWQSPHCSASGPPSAPRVKSSYHYALHRNIGCCLQPKEVYRLPLACTTTAGKYKQESKRYVMKQLGLPPVLSLVGCLKKLLV